MLLDQAQEKSTVLLLLAGSCLFTVYIVLDGYAAPSVTHYVPTLKINVVINLLGVDWIADPTISVMWSGQTKTRTIDIWDELEHQVNIVYDDPMITLNYQFRTPEDMLRGALLKTGYTVCIDSASLYDPLCKSSKIYKVAEPNQITLSVKPTM